VQANAEHGGLHYMMYAVYFDDDLLRDVAVFQHRFRMSLPLFRGIVEAL
jgi:hypothetical protein